METIKKEPQVKLDRRAVRSKRLIIEAWRELVLEKEYKKITVSDIVGRADIGRATFYAHFEDKEDLGRFIFNKLLQQIEAESDIMILPLKKLVAVQAGSGLLALQAQMRKSKKSFLKRMKTA